MSIIIVDCENISIFEKDHIQLKNKFEFEKVCSKLGQKILVFKLKNILYLILNEVYYTCEVKKENGKN